MSQEIEMIETGAENNNEKRFTFGVEGMTCASCVRIVERSLKKMDGVHFVSVNLGTEKAYVITDESVTFNDIESKIKSVGYKALEQVPDEEKIKKDFARAFKRMVIALVVMIPMTVLMVLHMAGFHFSWFVILEAVTAAFVLFVPGRGVIKSAYIAAVHFHANMDTMVAVAAFAAWVTSVLNLAGMDISSFGSISIMLVALHLTGRYIESKLKYNASGEIRSLLAMTPKHASVLQNEKIVKIPIESVNIDDLVVVRSGERIPLDGFVTEGSGYIDESMITGEPARVFREEGSELTGGTVLERGAITFRVTRIGDDTFLARMIKLVEDAQSSKVPIQAFADRVTNYFVPGVFTIAIVSALVWGFNYESLSPYLAWLSQHLPWIKADSGALSTSIFVFIAVLVIACPCALGLATPMALIAGSGLAAKQGLLIKNGESIQSAETVSVIFLDKTGTLTLGRPEVTETSLDDEAMAIALTLENVSIHPIAEAVQRFCLDKGIFPLRNITDIKEVAGEGVFASFNGEKYTLGRPLDTSVYSKMMAEGKTVVELRKGNFIAGYIAVSDPVKPDAVEAVAKIKNMGIKPVMLTGDSKATAEAVAALIGIDEFIAGVRPQEKLYVLQERQKLGERVCMVGDGINDAAALKAADIGIALGTGTDLSIESADIIITGGKLVSVPAAMKVSKITFSKIRQNLFWAFFYNIAALPAAVAGIMHPAIAEVCMIFSSMNVIINSASIRNKKIF